VRFEKQVTVDVPRQAVWDFLWDMARLTPCIPGCTGVEAITPYQRYQATVQDRVGPFKVRVPLEIEVLAATAPERLVARASGKDTTVQSLVKVEVELTMVETVPTSTVLHLSADVTVFGKLGTLGHSIIVRRGEAIIDQFAAAIQAALQHEEG
jgi:carbon monoxide dehydrogenase subunit G